MGLYEEGSVGSCPSFEMDIPRAYLHAGGSIACGGQELNTFVIKVMAVLGTCLSVLFGRQSGNDPYRP
jgi:hypothetical protein